MSRKLAILAAILLGSAAFVWTDISGNTWVEAMVGPNSVMHTKALPNDGADHAPYLPWSGTAADSITLPSGIRINKGDLLGGLWGGRRATSTQYGDLRITLTSLNGRNVLNGNSFKNSQAFSQDTWVSAGSVIPFIPCRVGVTCPWLWIH